MNVRFCPADRKTLSVRVCPETYDGLKEAAEMLNCTMQDAILCAILEEWGMVYYSPDALSCPITSGMMEEIRKRKERDIVRRTYGLLQPPAWWAEHLRKGDLPEYLDALAQTAMTVLAAQNGEK